MKMKCEKCSENVDTYTAFVCPKCSALLCDKCADEKGYVCPHCDSCVSFFS